MGGWNGAVQHCLHSLPALTWDLRTGSAAVTAAGAQQFTSTADRCLYCLMSATAAARGSLLLRQQLLLSSSVYETHTGLPEKGHTVKGGMWFIQCTGV